MRGASAIAPVSVGEPALPANPRGIVLLVDGSAGGREQARHFRGRSWTSQSIGRAELGRTRCVGGHLRLLSGQFSQPREYQSRRRFASGLAPAQACQGTHGSTTPRRPSCSRPAATARWSRLRQAIHAARREHHLSKSVLPEESFWPDRRVAPVLRRKIAFLFWSSACNDFLMSSLLLEPSSARRMSGAAVSVPALHLDRLTRRFGSHTVVDNVSLTVREGEVFGLLGAMARARVR